MAAVIELFIAFSIVIPLLPAPPKSQVVEQPVPERIVEFILEQKKPPPKVEPEPIEKPKVEAPVQEPRPARVVPKPDPRKKAEANMRALTKDLEALRDLDVKDVNDVQINPDDKANVSAASSQPRLARVAAVSFRRRSRAGWRCRDGPERKLTSRVNSPVPGPVAEATRTGSGKQASRSREEIELVFDKNKSAIYALYSRALRDNPACRARSSSRSRSRPRATSRPAGSCRVNSTIRTSSASW
jgi:hypothetical protein